MDKNMSSIEGLELFLNRLLALELEDLTFYFVGGLIRDMLWHQMTDDIDIAFEGAFEKLVEGLSGNYDLQLSSVNTIQLTIGHYHIDLAQMRYESYPFNDGMPVISAGAITDDIKRRDFTINTAYAICNLNNIKTVINFLSSKRTNPLEITYAHDYFLRDFNNRVIACLHEQSFLEDPTRLIRAIKYIIAKRCHFDKKTLCLFKKAIQNNYLRTLPSQRFFMTLLKLLDHEKWWSMVNMCIEENIFFSYYGKAYPKISSQMLAFENFVPEAEVLHYRLFIIYRNHIEALACHYPKKCKLFNQALNIFIELPNDSGLTEKLDRYYANKDRIALAKRLLTAYTLLLQNNRAISMAILGTDNRPLESHERILKFLIPLMQASRKTSMITGKELLGLGIDKYVLDIWKNVAQAIYLERLYNNEMIDQATMLQIISKLL